MTDERTLTIGLNTVPGLRSAPHHAALARFGSAAGVLAAPAAQLAEVRGLGPETVAAIRALDAARAGEAEERRARSAGATIVTTADPGYPAPLRELPDPPPVLYLLGAVAPEDEAAVAVVGARTATAYGRTMAARIAGGLAACGVTVVSGLARGVDAAAHRAALESGGRTIAVLGSGLDRLYPPEHRRLGAEIALRGAVLTEFPFGSAPERWHFPMRNRLVSGLARGVVVVEAAARSGALITADAALEQGRDVFAVPGPATAPTSAGTNRLIRQGATLVESAADVLEELPGLAARLPGRAPRPEPATTPGERRILEGLAAGPQPIDALVRAAGAPAADTAALLTALEVKGLVRQHPGNLFGLA